MHHLKLLAQRPIFRDDACMLAVPMQSLDMTAEALHRALPERLRRSEETLGRTREALGHAAIHLLDWPAGRVDSDRARLIDEGARIVERGERSWELYAARLEDLSPLGILNRGYAVCYDATENGGSYARRQVALARGWVRLASGSLGALWKIRERRPDMETRRLCRHPMTCRSARRSPNSSNS